jgi:hypothetical protein
LEHVLGNVDADGLDVHCKLSFLLQALNLRAGGRAVALSAGSDCRPHVSSPRESSRNAPVESARATFDAKVKADDKLLSVRVQRFGTFTRLDPEPRLIWPEGETRAVSISKGRLFGASQRKSERSKRRRNSQLIQPARQFLSWMSFLTTGREATRTIAVIAGMALAEHWATRDRPE